MSDTDIRRIINFNVGVLGHIDSGKTSLAKALSTVASTACFDKNPQSRERGITLDLGFSSFALDVPDHLKSTNCDKLQITLVDCPGHASLIRTIIGGAQIIDLMLLVVDITKGIQTQTAECLVLGEITCSKMIVILNKIDLLPDANKDALINKMCKKLHKTLEQTKFKDCSIIPVAVKPGGSETVSNEPIGVNDLIECLKREAYLPDRNPNGPFIFAVDHCFSIRGQGTVLTGTVISGSVSVNSMVEIPCLKLTRKVKSIQMFHVPVEQAIQGDRIGMCLTQFDPKHLERGLVCAPNVLPVIHAAIISVRRISYYKGPINSKAKFHVSVGHETVMAKTQFFSLPLNESNSNEEEQSFDLNKNYMYSEGLLPMDKEHQTEKSNEPMINFALLEFEKPVATPKDCLIIGSKLDSDIHLNVCRLGFQGKLLFGIEDKNYRDSFLPLLKVYKEKSKEGFVERMTNKYEIIGRGLFKKETNIQYFVGMKVMLSTGETGVIDGGFGQSGKIKINIRDGLKPTTEQVMENKKKKAKGKAASYENEPVSDIKILLNFKKYVYDKQKKIIQT